MKNGEKLSKEQETLLKYLKEQEALKNFVGRMMTTKEYNKRVQEGKISSFTNFKNKKK
ncbi:hypothetical protein [Flavobacterium alvei]|uniref:hypothetical protein n=1 Tax=Flavobacterium alvei TaxID=2080416 RepID=UPI0026F11D2D|nr:hypothetical protein [Flavobacterium alvei]